MGAGAACAGVWFAQRQGSEPGSAPQSASSGADDPWVKFWSSQFALLDGKPLLISQWRGKPLVLNFWATWCPPCIEELPMLDTFYKQKRADGWQMLAIAADSESKARAFLAKHPIQIPVTVLGGDAIALSKELGNLVGGLPFTVVLNSSAQVAVKKAGQVKPTDLETWVSIR